MILNQGDKDRTGQEKPWEEMTFANINGFAYTQFNIVSVSVCVPEESHSTEVNIPFG